MVQLLGRLRLQQLQRGPTRPLLISLSLQNRRFPVNNINDEEKTVKIVCFQPFRTTSFRIKGKHSHSTYTVDAGHDMM
jgi:hypothetical protein